jgi:prepilin-type N-terminal cleavage/methylation domain-containing protein
MWSELKRKRAEEGFTLIELLIVIIILAILAAIVVFAVGTTSGNAAIAGCKSNVKSVEVAIEAYKAQHNSTDPDPGNGGAWTAGNYNTSYSVLTTADGKGGPWLRSAPGTDHSTTLFNSAGQVWVNGANDYSAYAAGHDFDLNPSTACSVAS